jgi:hypothetical protein
VSVSYIPKTMAYVILKYKLELHRNVSAVHTHLRAFHVRIRLELRAFILPGFIIHARHLGERLLVS